jgi:DNA-binding transcriptional LysR family regulator
MTLDQCRYFLETSKFQHVGKAAKSLHISPSAISTAISNLEEELGAKLFERKGQGIQLTDRGQRFRSGIETILDQLLDLKISVGEQGIQHLSGFYRLAASHFLVVRYLGRAWGKIQTLHPQLSVELNAMATGDVVTNVLSGALDAGLCFSPLRHPDLKNVTIATGQLCLAVRKGHPLLKRSVKLQLSLLSQYPASIHKAVSGVDLCVDHPMFEKFGIVPKTQCFWDSDDLAVEMMKKTNSWSLMPDIVCHQHRESISRIRLPESWNAPYTVELIFRAHRNKNPFLALLTDELTKLMEVQLLRKT